MSCIFRKLYVHFDIRHFRYRYGKLSVLFFFDHHVHTAYLRFVSGNIGKYNVLITAGANTVLGRKIGHNSIFACAEDGYLEACVLTDRKYVLVFVFYELFTAFGIGDGWRVPTCC